MAATENDLIQEHIDNVIEEHKFSPLSMFFADRRATAVFHYRLNLKHLHGAVNKGTWPKKGSWAAWKTGLWHWRPLNWKTWNYYDPSTW